MIRIIKKYIKSFRDIKSIINENDKLKNENSLLYEDVINYRNALIYYADFGSYTSWVTGSSINIDKGSIARKALKLNTLTNYDEFMNNYRKMRYEYEDHDDHI